MGDYDLKNSTRENEVNIDIEFESPDEEVIESDNFFDEDTFDSIDASDFEDEEGDEAKDIIVDNIEESLGYEEDTEEESEDEHTDESDDIFTGFNDDFDLAPEIEPSDDIRENTPEDSGESSDDDLYNMSLEQLQAYKDSQSSANSEDDFDILPDNYGADDEGSIMDSELLLIDNFEQVSDNSNFISETGEIVVMDPSDVGDNFKIQYIDIENIAVVKRIRNTSTNVDDLAQSIKSTGLLEPLVVAPTMTEGTYVLLAGFRRLLACARLGKKKIPCIINIKANVPEIPVLEALYNHSKKYTIKEIVEYINYLEQDKGIMSASMIEYLLQMNSGDYTKLKDILNDDDDDIVSKLYDGSYTIEMAFKKLEQRRKKESAEEKENRRAAKVYDDTEESGADAIEGSGDEIEDDVELTDEEMQSFAFTRNDLNNIDDEDEAELLADAKVDGFEPNKQDYKNREKLDPDLRKAVLARDKNTCQICITNSGQEFVDVLDVHHIQEVYLGGDDNINNLITACTVCHRLIHKFGRGELEIRSLDEFESENERMRFKRIIKLGTVIRKGLVAKGLKREQLKKLDGADSIGRTKPGEGQQTT